MRHVYRLPRWVFPYTAAVLILAIGFGCNTLARWGGAGVGAGVGAAVGGPLGAVAGGIAGDAGGDALVADPPTNEYHNAPGGTIYAASLEAQDARPWYMNPWVWAAAYVVFRFRTGLLALLQSLLSGAFGAASLTGLGLLLGGKVSEKAKAATANARRRRAIPPPGPFGPPISQEERPHS